MLKKSIESALNKQVNAELYSSYLYLSMSAYFETISFKGFANWMRKQAEEEKEHAMKIYDYINDTGGKVILTKIDGPRTEWKSALEVFEEVYAHEQKVTALIHDLMDLAIREKDYATQQLLTWFVAEQVEEEANASEILDQIRLIGDAGGHLISLSRELGTRE